MWRQEAGKQEAGGGEAGGREAGGREAGGREAGSLAVIRSLNRPAPDLNSSNTSAQKALTVEKVIKTQ